MTHEEHQWLSNFGCNVLEMFGIYHSESGNSELQKRAFVTNATDKNYHSLEMLEFEADSKKIQMRVPKGDVLHRFRHDVENGKLPTISWLAPPEKFSDHPTAPWFGGWWISEIVDILYEKSRGLEEDDLHLYLRRKRRLLRSCSFVCRRRSKEPRNRSRLYRHRHQP